jgi:L-lactate utilization protein LutC
MMASGTDFIAHISRSLGRAAPITPPAAPSVDDAIARLVKPIDDLVARFIAAAEAAKLHVECCDAGELRSKLIDFVAKRDRKGAVDLASGATSESQTTALSRSRLVMTECALFDRLEVFNALKQHGIEVQLAHDAGKARTYEVEIGLTDVYAAVAETGSIVVRRSAQHPLIASLVPPVHVAVVERHQIVPDLLDLLRKLQAEGTAGGVTIITGPSKTADIEMNLVTGVHGPGEVHLFVI